MSVETETTEASGVNALLQMLLEDRRAREEELAIEMDRRESMETARAKQVEEQLGIMRTMLERSAARDEERSGTSGGSAVTEKVVLTKFIEGEDIEAFLTTFERLMTLYHVEEARWVAKLAPQLSGRALQAYAAMSADEALRYADVKKAILTRYDIREETYRQRFRSAQRKEGEPYIELATRMADLFRKWVADCNTVEAISEKLLIEQLLNTMPTDLRIWLSEKKISTCREVGKLADDYMMARQRTRLGTEITQRPQDSKKQGTNTSRSNNKCHNCLQPGHWARNCPKKKPHEDIPQSTTPTPSTPPLAKETTTIQQTERKCYI